MRDADLESIFTANVKQYRKRLGMTQAVLAATVDVDIRHIQNIEAGNRTPGVVIAYKITKALGVTLDDLFKATN